MTVFIDTAVIMYANGASHPLREPCRQIMTSVGNGRLDAVTSVEVVQEILHRFIAVRKADIGLGMARLTMDAFAPVVPVTHATMRRTLDLAERYPSLSARDVIHVATCVQEGIAEILTPDAGFDQVSEVRRIDPMSFATDPA